MIGGNVTAIIQNPEQRRSPIGEIVNTWYKVATIKGWLDLVSGTSNYTTYSAKIQESTHVFVCDYAKLPNGVKAEHSRMSINDTIYDIVLIDNPMGMNKQLEFYLKYTGGK